MFLRSLLFSLVLSLSAFAAVPKGDFLPFGDDFLPTFGFVEDYTESVVYSSEDEDFLDETITRLLVNARVSMKGVDQAMFAENPALAVDVGNLSISLDFDDGVKTVVNGKNVVTWFLDGTDPDTFDFVEDACKITVTYDSTELALKIEVNDVPDDFNVIAPDEAGSEEVLDNTPIILDFSVGDYGFTGRTCYVNGIATSYDKVVHGEDFFGLAKVNLRGDIDSVRPTVNIVNPSGRTVGESTLNVSGTMTDKVAPDRAFDPTTIKSVSVSLNGGAFVAASIDFTSGTWLLSGVNILPGNNTLLARAVDLDGNVDDSPLKSFKLVPSSTFTVDAAGSAAGKVTASFIVALPYEPGKPSPTRSADLTIGNSYTIMAQPGPDAVFNGWTSNAPLTPEQATSPKLTFTMSSALSLTATFVLNPFASLKGKYGGLVTADEATDRGFVTGKVSPKGVFSLKAKVGKLTFPLKGIFTGTGTYSGQVKVKGVTYEVDLALNVGATGAKVITGTIVGGDIDAEITADLGTFNKKANPVPADIVGVYNILISPDEANDDPNYPAGAGFGKAIVTVNGKVKFVGKLADGTPVAIGTVLTAEHTWPFFVPLYGKAGSISGTVAIDTTSEDNDVSATLDWFKPEGAKPTNVHAAGFEGQSLLVGSKFVKPTAGQLLFLQDTTGAGDFSVVATGDDDLDVTLPGTLSAAGAFSVTAPGDSPVQSVKCTINTKTGLVNGSFTEGGATRKFFGIVAPAKVNQMAGFFIRNGFSGGVSIGEPVVE